MSAITSQRSQWSISIITKQQRKAARKATRLNELAASTSTKTVKGHSHCAPASNSEIETGAIRAAKSAQYGAVRRVAALSMHDVQHNNSAPCGAAQRRAAPYGAARRRAALHGADGAQTVAALLRRTARSVNAPLGLVCCNGQMRP